jgi:hypothetical protein
MDPLSLIGGIQATTTVVAGCISTVQKLVELRKKYINADKTIRLLANELRAIQAAVGQIEGWYKFEVQPMLFSPEQRERAAEEPPPEELVEAFKITFEGCKLAMDTLEEEVDGLMSKNPFVMRMGVVWNEATMTDYAERLWNQVRILQLLTDSVKLYVIYCLDKLSLM